MVQDGHNFRIHIIAAVFINLVGLWLRFSSYEWIAIWMCIGMVFITEIINTAIEQLCNYISPDKNEAIGRVKDLAAAAVLVAAATSVVVILFLTILQ